MKRYVSILLLLLSVEIISAQGLFLDKNTSGFEVGADLSGKADKSYLGQGYLGYSYFGIMDLALSTGIGRANQSIDAQGTGFHYYSITPTLTLHALRQDENIPFTLSIFIAKKSDSYYSDVLNANNYSLTGDMSTFGIYATKRFSISPKINILPSVGFAYSTERDENQDNFGNWTRTTIDQTMLKLGCDATYKIKGNNLLRAGVNVNYSQDNTVFSASIGIVFPSTPHHRYYYYRRPEIIYAPVTPAKIAPQAIQPDNSSITINIPNANGGYTPVKLVKSNGGYIGPQGEFYTEMPTVEQLKVLYGK